MDAIAAKTRTLVEALPYIRRFHGAVFVVKYGGNVMTSTRTQASAMTDVVLLKHVGIHPIVVHGGGPEASRMMRDAGIEPRFVGGLRVTDAATLEIVRRSFAVINQRICGYLKKAGGKPIGLVAARNVVFTATQKDPALGFVGKIAEVDVRVVRALLAGNYIPVVSPLAADADGQLYNVNADTAATELACALGARKLTLLTNVPGVMEGEERRSSLTVAEARRLIKRGVITGGMIPKVEAAIRAVHGGVKKAHLIDGTTEHGILLEIFTRRGIGTEIVP
jgi:acetylglutamate kinase